VSFMCRQFSHSGSVVSFLLWLSPKRSSALDDISMRVSSHSFLIISVFNLFYLLFGFRLPNVSLRFHTALFKETFSREKFVLIKVSRE
jgi:hypothetical protein